MKAILILLLFTYTINAQFLLFSEEVQSLFALDLDGSTEYAYINSPTGLDLNSANYLADSNSVFTGTVASDWVSNGDVSLSFASDKMEVVASKDEEITNGGFDTDTDWVKGDSISISGGVAIFDTVGIFDALTQTSTLSILGGTYEVTYTILNYESGYVKAKLGSTQLTTRSANGTYTEQGVSTTTGHFQFQSFAEGTTLEIDNVSVKLVPTSSDYISISQDNFTTTMEHGKNYTVQFDAYSDGTLGSDVLGGLGDCSTDFMDFLASGVAYDAVNDEYDFTSVSSFSTYKNTSIASNDYVEVTVTIKNYSAGTLTYRYGGNSITVISGDAVPYTANGTYTSRFQNTGANGYFYINAQGFTGSIDDIIIKEITYSDLAIKVGNSADTISTTGTEATYAYTFEYDSAGMTIINETFDNWTNDNPDGWSVYSEGENNYATEDNGKCRIFTTGATAGIFKNIVTVGKQYRYYFDLTEVISGAINVGAGGSSYTSYSSVGSYTDVITAEGEAFVIIRTGTGAAADITIDNLVVEELPSLQLLPQSNDTYTIDDVDVSEAYDLEIEGWVNFSNITGVDGVFSYGSSTKRYQLLSINANAYFSIIPITGSTVQQAVISPFVANTWYHYIINIDYLTKVWNVTINDVAKTETSWSSIVNPSYRGQSNSLWIGRTGSDEFGGQIGNTTFTRTNGLGEVVSTSIYDWDGTSDTFLDDKGDQNNNLTGVNVIIDDIETYQGAYK